ncbi:hypothetical protein [Acuticoccus yangtzensis]|uniref:hypothetical protein n=1 Tax=Acuticoccus yangtzensis TaxID=1443441 RepID=UPI0011150AE9|nr:hypothetical protein [Acuticoccus yangtzensis]
MSFDIASAAGIRTAAPLPLSAEKSGKADFVPNVIADESDGRHRRGSTACRMEGVAPHGGLGGVTGCG